ncbi:HAD family hydrolase [Tabrizicola sp. BL-A-41-H6]|uniref:HAD family hydrolase n=1 Tax=Tabrizicola sp. BL-A-41-H6 TaxID=3421107 RepID=UPI003D66D783
MRALMISVAFVALSAAASADPLPSWTDGASKDAIISFVETVTDPASGDYVPPDARVAVFDNDGTLWAEQPVYFQFFFALDQLRARAAADPSILKSDVLRAAAKGDLETVMAGGTAALVEVVMASHADITVADFETEVQKWIATAKNPKTGQPLTQMTYQPMLELLGYLRDEDFSTWIVTGGGINFVRAIAGDAYGIPPYQVVGSMVDTEYRVIDGVGQIMQLPDIAFIDDKGGKPVGIARQIGLRPVLAFGNSDGDFEMLEYTTSGKGPSLGLILHHTDAEREFAYDRESHIGKLDRGLDESASKGWIIVDMARDWDVVWSGN